VGEKRKMIKMTVSISMCSLLHWCVIKEYYYSDILVDMAHLRFIFRFVMSFQTFRVKNVSTNT